MAGPQNLRAAGDRIDQLLHEVREGADARTAEKAEELLRLVSDLYGAGLARVVELARAQDDRLVDALVADDLVSSLLLVHDLHPENLTQRVEGALAKVRPLLASHAGDVELLDVDARAGAVWIRLTGSCDGCPSSSITLRAAVERAIIEAAPEIVTVDADEPSRRGPEVPVSISAKPVYAECPAEVTRA